MWRTISLTVIIIVTLSLIVAGNQAFKTNRKTADLHVSPTETTDENQNRGGLLSLLNQPTQDPSPTPSPAPLPSSRVIPGELHVFQTFNNCGPASLSMLLSYYGMQVSQAELGNKLRPYQVPGGDNDDKSVMLSELAKESEERGFTAYHRPGGNVLLLKHFIANDIPVLVRTWLKSGEDIGHYRVIRGYDDTTGEFIQDDSLQGKNLRYSYDDLLSLWQAFSYEYVVIIPPGKEDLARTILSDDIDEKIAWQRTKEQLLGELKKDPDDVYNLFNMSVAMFHLGDYSQSVSYFEKVESRLPFRMLWYQIEPIEAYYRDGQYDKVLTITDTILNNHNRAFSELYYLRGLIYKERGQTRDSIREFELARKYNSNFQPAINELSS